MFVQMGSSAPSHSRFAKNAAATDFMVQQNVGKCKYNKRIEVIMYNLNGRGGEGGCIKCIGKRGKCIENCEKCKKCPNL